MNTDDVITRINNGIYKCKLEEGRILLVDEEGKVKGRVKEYKPRGKTEPTLKDLPEEEQKDYQNEVIRRARQNKKRKEQGLLPLGRNGEEKLPRAEVGEGDYKERHRQAQQRYRKKQAEKKLLQKAEL